MTKYGTFAPDREREGNGWIKFPRDIEYRRKLFPDAVFNHPAKMNLYLVQDLVEYISRPGDSILDPFGGTGSTMMGALTGRNVVLVEVEDEFVAIEQAAATGLLSPAITKVEHNGDTRYLVVPSIDGLGRVVIIKGDNRIVLPLGDPVHAVITSPPYSSALKPSIDPLEVRGREGSRATYSKSALNIGNLNPFMFEQAMNRVWKVIADSLVVGGTAAIVSKDVVKGSERELLSAAIIRQAQKFPMRYSGWQKWKTPSTIRTETNKAKGGTVIEDEDILFFDRV